jgi:hypothetical protein
MPVTLFPTERFQGCFCRPRPCVALWARVLVALPLGHVFRGVGQVVFAVNHAQTGQSLQIPLLLSTK